MAYVLLGVAQAIGLLLIPFTSAGVWLQLGALALFGWWSGFEPVGIVPLAVVFALGVSMELASATLQGVRTRRPRRPPVGFAGITGAALGAVAGIPFPLIGSMFGALIGATLATSVAALYLRSSEPGRTSVGGEMVAVTLRAAAGVAVALFTILTLWR